MKHYQKYKKTIIEGVRKARRKRDIWINEYLAEKVCIYCGEAETCALAFYPDNKEIRIISTAHRGKFAEKTWETLGGWNISTSGSNYLTYTYTYTHNVCPLRIRIRAS